MGRRLLECGLLVMVTLTKPLAWVRSSLNHPQAHGPTQERLQGRLSIPDAIT